MKLVENWKDAYRWFSVQSMVAAGAILGAWVALPDDLKASLPEWADNAVAMSVLGLGVVGRLVSQSAPND